MVPGRKPVPTTLKEMRGNPGHRPINTEEPRPTQEVPLCPDHLDAEAKTEWEWIAPHLLACGVLTVIDKAGLAAYCQSYSRWARAERMLAQSGEVLKRPDGRLYPNPYLAVAKAAIHKMHALLHEFGMTPAARTRIRAAREDADLRILTLDEEVG